MYSLLLERPLTLFLCWIVVQFGLISVWSWRRTRRSGQVVLAGFAALPLLLGLSYLVVTPAEEVIAQCHSLAAAVDEGDMRAIRAGVAPDFHAAGLTSDEFLSRVEQTLTRIRVDRPRLSRFEVDFSEGAVGARKDSRISVDAPEGAVGAEKDSRTSVAVAQFSATCRIRSEEAAFDGLPTRWRVSFRRDGDRWLMTSIESIPVPPLNLRRLDDWLK